MLTGSLRVVALGPHLLNLHPGHQRLGEEADSCRRYHDQILSKIDQVGLHGGVVIFSPRVARRFELVTRF